MPPRVSVLLPAFEAEATLDAALRSVARQSAGDFECVVVDDGSADATGEIARAWSRRDPRFRVLDEPHRGTVGALLAGLDACRGGIVARMDADDLMHRDRLRAQVALLDARADLAAVGCHVRIFPRATTSDGMRDYERWLNGMVSPADVRRDALVECPVAHPSLAIRADVLRAHGYRALDWPEDWDLVLRLLAAGHEIGVVPRRLLAWRDHPGRETRSAERCRPERFPPLRASFLAEGLLSGGDEYVLWGYGHTGRALRAALAELGKLPVAIVEMHPGRLGNRIHGAPVVPPEAIPGLPRRPIGASVAGPVARGLIRERLDALGFA
ncbi:MAG: glycosyltransferase family 2 protein, partial [Alphaproteobacteria bacterium]